MEYCVYATPDTDSFEGVCRCCMSNGRVKNMLRTYVWMTESEVYGEMLVDCFSVDINSSTYLTIGICEFCIIRLRDANTFRKQVLSVGEALVQRGQTDGCQEPTDEGSAEIALKNVKLESELDVADEDWPAADEAWEDVKVEPEGNVEYANDTIAEFQVDPIQSNAEPKSPTLKQREKKHKRAPRAGLSPKRKTVPKFRKIEKYNELFPVKWYRNNFICYICKMAMTDFEVITNHLGAHSYVEIKQVYHDIRKGAKFVYVGKIIKCRRCKMNVHDLEEFQAHMFTLHNEKYLKTAETLTERIKLLKKEKDKPIEVFPIKWRKYCFTCIVCNEDLSDMDAIKRHVSVHSQAEISDEFSRIRRARKLVYDAPNLRCRMCKVVLNSMTDVKTHMSKDYHKTFLSRFRKSGDNAISYKLPYVLGKDVLDCPICGEHFMYNSNLNIHMNLHFPNYICETCGKAFATETRVRAHAKTHIFGEYPCNLCDKVFDTVTKRQHHISLRHRGGFRFYCSKCPAIMQSMYSRMRHLHDIHGEELRRYQCKLCPRRFITPGQQAGHVRKDHMNERNFECDICPAAFYLKSQLKRHMIKHGGAKIHVCGVCDKSYQRKSTLREHMKIHDTVKRHVCDVCGRRFTQKCTLTGHMKVHEKQGDV